jgi:hypothetical protein
VTTRLHPVLGFTRDMCAEPLACSLCGHEIPEDHIPLMLFGPGNDEWAYCYCSKCDTDMLKRLHLLQGCGGDNR